jgi:hypothetical protein
MFDSAVRKIDFEGIDRVKLIPTKIELKVKWFMFEYIHSYKNELNNKFRVKINSGGKINSTPLESILTPPKKWSQIYT